ncbi:MAG: hypothetical protein UX09_C0040G0002 [Candidatus Uhrbacteria bacterium GW2011_GWE2_45_35]|uniref:Uncharacterized protein n=2 Tax=Candidatus Uhriibacteriota TaxID=1752732 RepID=A0A0G1LMU4_9BACT|nr:MAG: hypothetical protein UW63_C0037G0012 [Candidatus Uhrbacteria bacterium GW2011_GWF2_44_350]KKU06850.1 MAG: hypothetical protein UX09_C0040G0002 [Candidatus Uhrbacteria bacterium GW2011_GWE2_45_35]HBR80775.1 hypothetical protein [Candidatus Uhrbacteria bacterium]HCU31771.1 hypothetical protein [Candidatus Uhrbacteria bacterium]
MFTNQDLTFFGRRLRILLFGLTVTKYHENFLENQVTFTVIGQVFLEDKLLNKICRLCEAASVSLTPFGNSAIVIVRGVNFPFWQ